jgi:hypothetical protein
MILTFIYAEIKIVCMNIVLQHSPLTNLFFVLILVETDGIEPETL